MEWFRSRMQESEQARGAGLRLGAPAEGSLWSPSDADWMSAARMGRRRRATAAAALADVTVRPPPKKGLKTKSMTCAQSHCSCR
jgi:hypothetical protein